MSHWHGDYVDGPATPLWPFGFGRSYTRFELSNLRLDPACIPTLAGETTVRVDIRNVGERSGDEVVQLYVHDLEASVTRPIEELRGFKRVRLGPGDACTVAFRLASEQLGLLDRAFRQVIEPGHVRIWAGSSSGDLKLTADLELTGTPLEITDRRRYLTPSTIENRAT